MSSRWKFEDTSHNTRAGFDVTTGDRVAVISKLGDQYHITLVDRTAPGTPSKYIGARATLGDAQSFAKLVNDTMRVVEVDKMRSRGEVSEMSIIVTALDLAEREELLEDRAGS